MDQPTDTPSYSRSIATWMQKTQVKILAGNNIPQTTGPADQLWTKNNGKSIDQPGLLTRSKTGPFGPLSSGLWRPFLATFDVQETVLSQCIMGSCKMGSLNLLLNGPSLATMVLFLHVQKVIRTSLVN